MRGNFCHRLTKKEWVITAFAVFHTVSNLFLGTFVVSFLMHNTINEIVSISTYRFFEILAICLTFVITANWCKNGNRTVLFGMNIVARIILMGLIAVLGSNAAGWLVVLGILYGVFEGFYNLPMHAITIENVCAKRMVFFVGTKEAIVHTFKILVPVTLGTMLTTTSLQSVAWAIMIMAIMEFFMLFLLPPCRNPKHQPIDFIGFYNHLRETPLLRKIFLSELLRSFAWILETVVVMYIVDAFHTDMNLGIWSTIFAICTIVASWAFGRFCSNRDFRWIVLSCSVLLAFSAAALIIGVNRFSILLYSFAYAVGIVTTNKICGTNILNVGQSRFVIKNIRIEYLVMRDVVLFFGRWAGCLCLMYIGAFNLHGALQYLIAILFLSHILACVISARQTRYLSGKCQSVTTAARHTATGG